MMKPLMKVHRQIFTFQIHIHILIFLDVLRVLQKFIERPIFDSESNLRLKLWDKIYELFFSDYSFEFLTQMNMTSIDKIYPVLFVDGYAGLKTAFENGKISNLPLLLIEIDKH